METRKPHHHTPLSSLPRRIVVQDRPKGFTNDTTAKSPLFSTPMKQLVRKDSSKAKEEKPGATENLVVARINGVNHATCATPIKTPFGTPSQPQTPTSKLAFLSASGHKHSAVVSKCGVDEDVFIPRTPFRLLAGKNLNACLFSPLHTPRLIASPAALDKLGSPALKGHAKRVFVMPPQLSSPARRVPVKQKGSQPTSARKQSLFSTPKSTSRVDRMLQASCQNDDDSVTQHHDVHNKRLEGAAFPKRVLAFTPQQSPFATPNSSRVKATCQNNGVSDGNSMQHHDAIVKDDKAELERLALLKRVLASTPLLSTPARRVPLRHKPLSPLHHKEKQPSKKLSPLRKKEKQPTSKKLSPPQKKPSTKSSSLGTSKSCKTGQRKARTHLNDAKAVDAEKGTSKSCKTGQRKVRTGVNDAKALDAEKDDRDKAKQQSDDDANEMVADDSKQHDDEIGAKYHDDDDHVKRQCNKNDSGSDDAKQPNVDSDDEVGCNNAKQHDTGSRGMHHDDFENDDDKVKQQSDTDECGSDGARQLGDHDDIGGKWHDDVDGTDACCDHVDEDGGIKQECRVYGVKQFNDDGDDGTVCNDAMQPDDADEVNQWGNADSCDSVCIKHLLNYDGINHQQRDDIKCAHVDDEEDSGANDLVNYDGIGGKQHDDTH